MEMFFAIFHLDRGTRGKFLVFSEIFSGSRASSRPNENARASLHVEKEKKKKRKYTEEKVISTFATMSKHSRRNLPIIEHDNLTLSSSFFIFTFRGNNSRFITTFWISFNRNFVIDSNRDSDKRGIFISVLRSFSLPEKCFARSRP